MVTGHSSSSFLSGLVALIVWDVCNYVHLFYKKRGKADGKV
jgi:hypothetical protein